MKQKRATMMLILRMMETSYQMLKGRIWRTRITARSSCFWCASVCRGQRGKDSNALSWCRAVECHQEARHQANKDGICLGDNWAYQAYVNWCWSSPPPAQACKLESCEVHGMAPTKSHRGPTRYFVPKEWDKPSKISHFECRAWTAGWRSTSSWWAFLERS